MPPSTNNAFAVLDDSDSESEAPAPVKNTKKAEVPFKRAPIGANKPGARKPKAPTKSNKSKTSAKPAAKDMESWKDDRGAASRNKGRRNNRGGGRGGKSNGRSPRREFDRRSGTGNKTVGNKKDGAGKHNWGSDATAAADETAAAEKVEGDNEEAVVEEEEEEDNQMSLEEYKAAMEAKKSENAEAFGKKEAIAVETGDDVAELVIEDDTIDFMELDHAGKAKRKRRKNKGSSNIAASLFADSDNNRRDDSRRGGKGGRGGARGGRNNRRKGRAPNTSDMKLFPALSSGKYFKFEGIC